MRLLQHTHATFSAALLVLACLLVGEAVAQKQTEPTIITVFGDSMSLGYNQVWVNTYCNGDPVCPGDRNGNGALNLGTPSVALKAIMDGNKRPAEVVNFGAGGSASGPSMREGVASLTNGLDRILASLQFVEANYGNERDSFILIFYGSNDFGYEIDAATTGFNIGQLINISAGQGVIPIVGSVPPRAGRSAIQTETLNGKIEQAANAASVAFVDHYQNLINNGWFTNSPEDLDDDGIHPTDAGYQVIAQHWFDAALEGLVKPDTTVITGAIYLLLSEDEEEVPE